MVPDGKKRARLTRKRCIECQVMKEQSEYSGHQWKQPFQKVGSKCQACAAAAQKATMFGSTPATNPEIAEQPPLTQEQGRRFVMQHADITALPSVDARALRKFSAADGPKSAVFDCFRMCFPVLLFLIRALETGSLRENSYRKSYFQCDSTKSAQD